MSTTDISVSPDLGIIDVDGQDWHLWNTLDLYRPRVMLVEIFPPDAGAKIPPLRGEGQAGLNAIEKLGKEKGYQLVATTYCNALFVEAESLKSG